MTPVRLDEDLQAALARFIRDRNVPPQGEMSPEAAINVIVGDWLMAQGYLPLPNQQDAILPALDAADVPKD